MKCPKHGIGASAFLVYSFATRHKDPLIFTQAPPAVGNMITPGPCQRPEPTLGCLQMNTSCPSAKTSGLRCEARSTFSILLRLSRAAHALVAACLSSSALRKSSSGSVDKYVGSILSSDTKVLGRRCENPNTRCIGEKPLRLWYLLRMPLQSSPSATNSTSLAGSSLCRAYLNIFFHSFPALSMRPFCHGARASVGNKATPLCITISPKWPWNSDPGSTTMMSGKPNMRTHVLMKVA